MIAVSDGNEPPAEGLTQFQQQITQKQIAVLVYNIQTVSPITTGMQQLADSKGIPIVGISETIVPVGASFQDWQIAQLMALQNALKLNH
jgi:zinc/manganese transport system substrate-binding protein